MFGRVEVRGAGLDLDDLLHLGLGVLGGVLVPGVASYLQPHFVHL